jgi:hypothetical protein
MANPGDDWLNASETVNDPGIIMMVPPKITVSPSIISPLSSTIRSILLSLSNHHFSQQVWIFMGFLLQLRALIFNPASTFSVEVFVAALKVLKLFIF